MCAVLAVREKYVLEVNAYCAFFLFQQGSKHVHILSSNPFADAQDDKILSTKKPVDSEGYCVFISEPSVSCRSAGAAPSVLGLQGSLMQKQNLQLNLPTT